MSIKSFLAIAAACSSLAMIAQPANAAPPSFNCGSSRLNDAERTICQSRYLSRLDRRLSRKYFQVHGMLAPWARYRLRNVQRMWIYERNSCEDFRRCIASAYGRRIRQLKQFENCFDHTASPRCIPRLMRRHARSLH